MKILYGIQGTGNGHISRAMEIVPALMKRGHVDTLISGTDSELHLPFPIKHRYSGLGFVFGKNGGIDLLSTYKKNRLKRFYNEIRTLNLDSYDLIISDFEPVTAWASMLNKRSCVALSNQASLLSSRVPTVNNEDFVGKFIIRNYAPCPINFGISYARYDDNIYTPIIRKSLIESDVSNQGHFLVYLPAFSDKKIIQFLSQFKGVDWRVFSKRTKSKYQTLNLKFFPLDKNEFEREFLSAAGIVTAAGFGTTTEALHFGKKLLIVPQKHQYEQACNAKALEQMGVARIPSIKDKYMETVRPWLRSASPVHIKYPDVTEKLIDDILLSYPEGGDAYLDYLTYEQYMLRTA
ncbi:MAG: glycosyltransferase family protein [Cryomorphaceae bacterium]